MRDRIGTAEEQGQSGGGFYLELTWEAKRTTGLACSNQLWKNNYCS
jgi:hypothetical protein